VLGTWKEEDLKKNLENIDLCRCWNLSEEILG
jgi:hypothetical protein